MRGVLSSCLLVAVVGAISLLASMALGCGIAFIVFKMTKNADLGVGILVLMLIASFFVTPFVAMIVVRKINAWHAMRLNKKEDAGGFPVMVARQDGADSLVDGGTRKDYPQS